MKNIDEYDKPFSQYLLDQITSPAFGLGISIGTLITSIVWMVVK